MRSLIVVTLAACSAPSTYPCTEDEQCVRGSDVGVCQSEGFCSFFDEACPSRQRFDDSASDPLAGQCVESVGCVEQLALGDNHTCVRLTSNQLRCWGGNLNGQIGNGSRGAPVLEPRMVAGIFDALDVAAGESFTCAATESGPGCWGNDSSEKLGNGDAAPTDTTIPMPVAPPLPRSVSDVTAGDLHACATTPDGEAWCWGSNSEGMLGDGTRINAQFPTEVMATVPFDEIHASRVHTCARDRSGDAWCWGQNSSGQLGLGNRSLNNFAPMKVTILVDTTQLAIGEDFTCARTGASRVSCWGVNDVGQLGLHDRDTRDAPEQLVLPEIEQVAAGANFACARTNNSEVYCWGANNVGQLGIGMTGLPNDVPAPVPGINDAVEISAGATHACVRHASGRLSCWGGNLTSQTVIGDEVNNTVPTPTDAGFRCPP